jgi:hypothetical protein
LENSENEDLKDELPDYHFRKVLHEPLAPYVVESYNRLTNLIQGLTVAAIFFVVTQLPEITPLIVCNLIICLTVVIFIWHTYITTSQYYVMRASPFNTIIPVILGFTQVALALTVDQPIYIFTMFLTIVMIIFLFQIVDNIHKDSKPQALEIWKEHYKELGTQFAQDIFDEYRRYQRIGLRNCFLGIMSVVVLTSFNYLFPISLEIKGYISFIIVEILFLIVGLYFSDLNRFFNNSEKLKKYGYEW